MSVVVKSDFHTLVPRTNDSLNCPFAPTPRSESCPEVDFQTLANSDLPFFGVSKETRFKRLEEMASAVWDYFLSNADELAISGDRAFIEDPARASRIMPGINHAVSIIIVPLMESILGPEHIRIQGDTAEVINAPPSYHYLRDTTGGMREGANQFGMFIEAISLGYRASQGVLPEPACLQEIIGKGRSVLLQTTRLNHFTEKILDQFVACGINPYDAVCTLSNEDIEVFVSIKPAITEFLELLSEKFFKVAVMAPGDREVIGRMVMEVFDSHPAQNSNEFIARLEFGTVLDDLKGEYYKDPDERTVHVCAAVGAGIIGEWYDTMTTLFIHCYSQAYRIYQAQSSHLQT